MQPSLPVNRQTGNGNAVGIAEFADVAEIVEVLGWRRMRQSAIGSTAA